MLGRHRLNVLLDREETQLLLRLIDFKLTVSQGLARYEPTREELSETVEMIKMRAVLQETLNRINTLDGC